MISFGITYWFIFLFILLMAAAGITMLLYFRNKENKELKKKQQGILIFLRFLSFSLIAFLLLSPFMRSLKRVVQTPLILVAWDNSGSMVATGDSLELANGMKQLKDKLSDELGDDHSLINYTFGQETVSSGELGFSEKKIGLQPSFHDPCQQPFQ